MLDLLGILFSSIIMFLVIFRAIQLDSEQPWFIPRRTGTDGSGLKLDPGEAAVAGREARQRGVRRE